MFGTFFLVLTLIAHLTIGAGEYKPPPAVHFTLSRRLGPFAWNRTANLTFLSEQLAATESRFNVTQREVKGNKIVRVPKQNTNPDGNDGQLLGDVGKNGSWFATLRVGASKQPVDVDLDMLTADFAIKTTSSPYGTKFDEFFSKSYQHSTEVVYPTCVHPTDGLSLPYEGQQLSMSFPRCTPHKQSRDTLTPSGGIFGLALADSLRQINHPSVKGLIQQLLDAKIIEEDVFSITLINGYEGILSIGGTVAEAIKKVDAEIDQKMEGLLGKPTGHAAEQVLGLETSDTDFGLGGINDIFQGPAPDSEMALDENIRKAEQEQLEQMDGEQGAGFGLQKRELENNPEPKNMLQKRSRTRPKPNLDKAAPSWRDNWQWSPVEGADGWWQTLMRGVWVNLVKVLKNQPVIVDLSTPFILAPPVAAKQFYASISGSYRLPAPYSNFYAYPCNNPPVMHVEFGGWRFPAMRGMKTPESSIGPNGKFSLGKVSDDSGYCVGAVVETRMGVGDQSPLKKSKSRKEDALRGINAMESGMLAGNGMRDVWVLGEPIFRGLGLVFDIKSKSIGFRAF